MQELTFKDILKILIPKFKMLVVLLVLGAILGGCIGVASSYSKQFYGTEIAFYVSPKPGENAKNSDSQFGVYGAYGWHVMDNITKLLSSESFAEELLLDENRLPIDKALPDATDEKRAILDSKIAAIRVPVEDYEKAKADLELATEDYTEKQKEYSLAVTVASKANSLYLTLLDSQQADNASLNEAREKKEAADIEEERAKLALETAELEMEERKVAVQEKQAVSEESYDEVYEIWRETEVYREHIKLIMDSVSFAFYDDRDLKIGTSTETLAKSFIYVNINVSDSLDVATFVYDRVIEVLPRYVQINMAVPSGYVGTNCQRISRLDEVEEAQTGTLLVNAVVYAFVGGVLLFFAAAVLVVVLDVSKKWYRSNKGELTSESSANASENTD